MLGLSLAILHQQPVTPTWEIDLRPQLERWNLKPRSQGSRPTCSVFTTVAAIEYAYAKKRGKGVELSVEYLDWAGDNVINNHANDGAFFHNALAGFEKFGICPEKDMPYQAEYDGSRIPDKNATSDAQGIANLGLKTHWIKRWDNTKPMTENQFQAVLKTLKDGYPVAAGSDHSRLLIGYRTSDGGTFETKDSGIGGYGEVPFEFVKSHVYDAFWVEAPASK